MSAAAGSRRRPRESSALDGISASSERERPSARACRVGEGGPAAPVPRAEGGPVERVQRAGAPQRRVPNTADVGFPGTCRQFSSVSASRNNASPLLASSWLLALWRGALAQGGVAATCGMGCAGPSSRAAATRGPSCASTGGCAERGHDGSCRKGVGAALRKGGHGALDREPTEAAVPKSCPRPCGTRPDETRPCAPRSCAPRPRAPRPCVLR